MREAMKDSGEEWNAKFSDMPRRLFDVPGGSCGGWPAEDLSDWRRDVDVMKTVDLVDL